MRRVVFAGSMWLAGCESGLGEDGYECIVDAGPSLVVSTTDFSTGALTVIDVDDRCVQRDVALASTDAIPWVHDGLVYSVNRHGHDYLDVLDPAQGWRLLREQPIVAAGTSSANPRALAIAPDGLAYVSLYGASQLQVHDLAAGEQVDAIDLSSFADADGIAESPLSLVYSGELFVFLERLDRTDGWASVADDIVVVVDLATRELVDLDPDEDGVQGFSLLGRWPRQWRWAPQMPGHVFVLSNGLQRIDLAARTATWVVDEASMLDAGIDDPSLPQSFDVSDEGRIFIAAYTPDREHVRILEASADGTGGLEVVVDGLNASERTLEVVGDEIWFGDTTPEAAGMRAFGFDGTPSFEGAIPTGLPPYSVASFD